MPASHDTLRISHAEIDATMDFSATGANYSWDFSALQSTGQQLNDYKSLAGAPLLIQFNYGAFAWPEYQASYYLEAADIPVAELSSFLPVSIENINQFSRNTSDSLTLVGYSMVISGQELPVKSDTIETKYKFPLHFGDSYSSRGYTQLDMNPIYNAQWRQHRARHTEVDGWGQLLTPYGTFDVLRIHHVIAETDSFYVVLNNFGFWVPIQVPETHIYEWRAAGQREPILQVNTAIALNQEQITDVMYRDLFIQTAGLSESSMQVHLYPNPVNDQLRFSATHPVNGYHIYSTDGRLISSESFGATYSQTIALPPLQTGTYYLLLESDLGSTFRTFVK